MKEVNKNAIITRKLCFSYDTGINKKPVLNCVDMNVPQGVIYGLLGPSGCGKTSLLKAIIGLLKPDAGFVSVFGQKPGSVKSDIPGVGVGYMPQEIGLKEYLKVKEIFYYFGKIYFKSDRIIKEKMHYFLKLLNLTDANAVIGTLSGGQKRRLSLAITVFTEPRLLILDEPTVGVDPLLSNKIWEFLKQISSTKRVTIIVTTHYVEEMKCVQKVAFMRHGEILKEDTPNNVLAQYDKDCLEDVFYELSYNQRQRKRSLFTQKDVTKLSQHYSANDSHTSINDKMKAIKYWASTNYSIISILIWENFIKYFRHSASLLILFVPMFVASMSSLAIGRIPNDNRLGWVVYDHYDTFIFLNSNFTPNTETESSIYNPYLPDILYDQFNKSIVNLINYENLSSAIDDVKRHKIFGVLYLPSNFSFEFFERDVYLNGHNEWVENSTIEAGTVHLWLDMSNKLLGNIITHEVYKKVLTFREKAYEAIGVHKNVSLLPIKFTEDINGNEDDNYYRLSKSITLGLFIAFIFGLSSIITSTHFHTANSDDLFARIYSIGIRPHQIFSAVIFVNFVILAFTATINLLYLIYVLNVQCKGYLIYAIINITLVSLSGVSSGLLFALLLPNTFCNIFSTGYIFTLFAVSGSFWQIEALPYFMKIIAVILPIAIPTAAMRRIFDYENMDFITYILEGSLVSVILTVFYSIISLCILRKKH